METIASIEPSVQDCLSIQELDGPTPDRALNHVVQSQQVGTEIVRLKDELQAAKLILSQQQDALADKNRRLSQLYDIGDRFIDNASHEFRTPLTVVKDYIALVRDGLAGDVNDEQSRLLDTAAVRADDLGQLIDDLLDTTKLDAGLLGSLHRNCCVADVIAQMQAGLERRARVMEITFEVDCPDPVSPVYCDAEQLSRIIGNFVLHAFRCAGKSGRVQLSVVENGAEKEIVIAVTDNGPGIDDRARHLIFQRFQQVEAGIQTSTKGIGLGLNIARELVDRNFGEMNLASVVGQGSTFSFSIPLVHPPEVMRRYLVRLARDGGQAATVSLIQASIDQKTEADAAAAADCFFNFILRRDDLLFRQGRDQWLLVVPTTPIELQQVTSRIYDEYLQANRRRPHSPLPSYELCVLNTWPALAGRDEVLACFDKLFSLVGSL